jgi:cobalt-zinc-cadmium efflux system outer membrane protein
MRRAAGARVEAARGALDQASRLPNPTVDIRQENLPLTGGERVPLDEFVDVFAVFNQPIELGGKRAARRAVATAELDVAVAGVSEVERELTLQTVRVYLAALQAHLLINVLTESREGFQIHMDTMSQRVTAGYAAEADLMKFRTEAARFDIELVRTRLEFGRNAEALGSLVGSETPIAGKRLREPTLLDPPRGNVEDLVRHALDKHPGVIAARARLERARQALALERSRQIPDVTVAAGYKRTGGDNTLVTGVLVPLPLFDRNAGNIEQALAEERAATFELDALSRQQTVELKALLLAAQELTGRAHDVEVQLLQPAEVVRKAARSAFREGAANILQLVDAERMYTDTQREALQLKLDAYAKAFEARLVVSGEGTP